MSLETNNTKALDSLLAPHRQELNLLAEAMKEVAQEDNEKKKESAKALIREAIALKVQMDQAQRDFESKKKKCDKALGKLIRRLENMSAGRPIDEGVEETEGKSEE